MIILWKAPTCDYSWDDSFPALLSPLFNRNYDRSLEGVQITPHACYRHGDKGMFIHHRLPRPVTRAVLDMRQTLALSSSGPFKSIAVAVVMIFLVMTLKMGSNWS